MKSSAIYFYGPITRDKTGRAEWGRKEGSLKWRMTEIEGSVTLCSPLPPFLFGNNLVPSDQVLAGFPTVEAGTDDLVSVKKNFNVFIQS